MRPNYYSLFSVLLLAAISFAYMPKAIFSAPPEPVGAYLNGIFPDRRPAVGGSWELEDVLPGQTFYGPNRIIPFPGTEDVLLLGLDGELWRINFDNQFSDRVLDISESTFALSDAGTVGIVLHPRFGDPTAPDKQLAFIYYRTKPDAQVWDEIGYNVLSKFSWDPVNEVFDPASEEILFRQYDRYTWHNGGGMFFDEEGLLYISIGDEGADFYQDVSTQRLDGGFFSGILRIDVDNDPTRSHPIIRQPLANDDPPAGWPGTFSQGYSIPNDNPWLSPDGEHLEEFFALGLRSPHSMIQDEVTGEIWVADVGGGHREEISKVEKGDNLQWPWLEGTRPYNDNVHPDVYIGNSKGPYAEYERGTGGACIIGGSVYHGTEFASLRGKYLFADYMKNRLMAIDSDAEDGEGEIEILIDNLSGSHPTMPDGPGVTGVFPQADGSIIITVIGNRFTATPGKLYRLRRAGIVPDPPALLSEIGAFTDLQSLTPVPGMIPYQTTSQLYSDNAVKDRWMIIPNDGTYDSPSETVNFNRSDDWDFPPGTVFIKNFALNTRLGEPNQSRMLETRFFIIGEDQSYGLSYHWNEEGTEAYLAANSDFQEFEVFDEEGQLAYVQRWDYPSRGECMSCHTSAANFVLGVETHQLNSDFYYPELGREVNQLAHLDDLGVFDQSLGDLDQLPRAAAIDDEQADLGLRIRSYLDANCASCHRPGGVSGVNMDLRFNTPLFLSNIINAPNMSNASNQDGVIVKPGFHQHSQLWIRDASLEETRMPPIGRNLVDEYYVDKLAE
ncbi:MAG: PQQ-dependent sugar dehydrogenase, partial [Bacteroidota bacterium]